MKAIVCSQLGGPELLELLELPSPPLKPAEVRIAVASAGVNFPDILQIAGKYQMKLAPPFTPGAEVAGTVLEVGSKVSHLRVGDAVTAIVVAVSDDKSLPKETRKALQIAHAAALSHPAKLVKLADKICNLRDLLNAPPADWTAERKLAYFQWTEAVVAGLRGTHVGLEAILDDLLARADRLR